MSPLCWSWVTERAGKALFYTVNESSPKGARLSGTLHFVETWRQKSLDNFPRLRFSRLWGIELWLSLQLWVHAAVCGSRTEQRKIVLLHSFKSVQTVRPVINPQVTMPSSAMAWDETWKMQSRAYFLLFTGRKSLSMGSVSHWHTLD